MYVGKKNYGKQSMHLGSVIFLVWFYCPSFLRASGKKETASCSTTSAVLGETAHVTCDFPVEVTSVRPVIISVETNLGEAPTEVLECQWLEEGEAQCSTAEGYTYIGPAGSQLTLVVSKMAEQHAGQYVCKMMTPNFLLADIEPCVLELRPQTGTEEKPDEVTSAANITMVPSSDNRTEVPEEAVQKGHEDNASHITLGPVGTKTIVVVTVVIVSLLLMSLIVAVCLKMKHREIKSRKPEEDSFLTAGPETPIRGCWRARLKFFMNFHGKDKERREAGFESKQNDPQGILEDSGVMDLCHVQVASDTIHPETEQSLLEQEPPDDEDEDKEDKGDDKPSISDFNEQIKAAAAGMSLKLKQRKMSESEI